MPWDDAWELGSLTISDVCRAVVLEKHGGSSFVDPGQTIPHRDGFRLDPQASLGPLTVPLRTVFRFTDAAGAVTHADDEDGHVAENLSKFIRELSGAGLATLKRTAPNAGQIRALCRLLADPIEVSAPAVFRWFLTVPSGSWQDDTESNSGAASTTPSVTTSGDRRIHDPKIQFNAAGTLTHTRTDGVVETVQVVSGPTFPVTVWIAGTDGSSELYAEDDGGVDVSGDVVLGQPWGLRFEPNTVLSLSADVNVIVFWRNRWA